MGYILEVQNSVQNSEKWSTELYNIMKEYPSKKGVLRSIIGRKENSANKG
jgi:hypothetical protein